MDWEQKRRRTGLVQVAVMAFWFLATIIGMMLRSLSGWVLAAVATVSMLGYMAWVIRDSRKITTEKDGQLHRGPDSFLSGRRR